MCSPRRAYDLRRTTHKRKGTSNPLLSTPEECRASEVDVEVYGSLLLCLEKLIPLKGNVRLSLALFSMLGIKFTFK